MNSAAPTLVMPIVLDTSATSTRARARAHACTRARARVRVCACARAFVCVRVQVCLRVRVSEAEVARLFTSDPRAHTCVEMCMRRRQKLC